MKQELMKLKKCSEYLKGLLYHKAKVSYPSFERSEKIKLVRTFCNNLISERAITMKLEYYL